MSDSRAQRAARRRDWPGRVTNLDEQDDATIVRHGSPADRVLMLWRVTLDAWASSGRPLPTYRRDEIPGRIVRTKRDGPSC